MEGFLCDILLKVKENEFPAHKSLLACSSDYFRAMFKSYTQESKASVIHLQVVSPTGLQHILDFIYTSLLPLSFESLEDTLEAASYLQVTDAIGLCNQYLVNNLALENCCFSANVARKFYLPDALAATEKYIIKNVWKLLDLDLSGLLELNFRSLLAVIQSPDLPMVEECRLLDLVLLWLKQDKSRLDHASSLLEHIRYGLIPVEKLRKTYTQSEVSLSAGINVCVVGNFLYVLGGEIQSGVLGDVHRYDPRFNTWTQITGMLEKRCQFSCCVLGKDIFAIGGRGEDGSLHSSVEVYDISRDRWTKARELPCRIHGHASAVCKNTIYISGGKYSAPASTSNDVYSLSSLEGQWVKRAPMSIARFGHQMATIRESIFTFLGLYEPFSEIERYDPDKNQWIRLRPLVYDRFSYGLAVVEETALLIGGKKWQNSLEVSTQDVVGYDIDNDGWEEICRAPLPWWGLQCAVLQLAEVPEEQDWDSQNKKLPNC
uniref:Kelch like family member 34 n=1 Tax=Malurus cyaneus samueli TaxID=2593467 RepID=A0A8C5U186_9PASS